MNPTQLLGIVLIYLPAVVFFVCTWFLMEENDWGEDRDIFRAISTAFFISVSTGLMLLR